MPSCPQSSNIVPLFPGLAPQTDSVAAGVCRVRHAMAELMFAATSAENRGALMLAMDIRAAIEEYETVIPMTDERPAPDGTQGR